MPWNDFSRPAACGLTLMLIAGAAQWQLLPAADPDDRPVSAVDQLQTGRLARPVSLDVARDRANVMHDVYLSTLDAMHRRYFHGDRAVVPARALEDVFRDIERRSQIEARWISASFSPMSIDHEPKTDFERKAARELAEGKDVLEVVEHGYFRRAGGVPLTGGCIGCHAGFFKQPSPTPKFAGLIISMPVETGAKLSQADAAAAP